MSAPAICFVGDDALAVRIVSRPARHALAGWLRASGVWLDVVPGKQDVIVQFDPLALPPGVALDQFTRQVHESPPPEEVAPHETTLHMQVDAASAPDLARIAAENGLTPKVFLRRITASDLVVDMMGFTAGFAYVAGADPKLVASRLDIPRQKVPAGSVGFITGQLGLYALAGPAGWPIIGRITEPLFDAGAQRPFRLEAGVSLRLRVGRAS
ncbi:allophanate hydrolase subunit 1 [Hyphomonas sp. WL0036]|uniref:5-oxoprolinase subunit B family protein n=1 Tax=Hyphomonas sediminis TaxID=2866160 RepID=UPI001C7F25E1|nr:carboxyltransferase domain-containing protein [Hyphomonas sediminis]MBY9067183.1 allophanate hydrolase subunit 1 [Hyphomonas sediminis]